MRFTIEERVHLWGTHHSTVTINMKAIIIIENIF
jgi:hypothetical protein